MKTASHFQCRAYSWSDAGTMVERRDHFGRVERQFFQPFVKIE
jgi:hypothetical protein